MDPELLKIVKCWNLWQIRGSQVIFKGNLTAKNQQQREPIWSWMELNAERSVILHSCYGLLIPLSLLLTIFKAWLIANVWTYIKRIFQFKCRYSPCVRPYFLRNSLSSASCRMSSETAATRTTGTGSGRTLRGSWTTRARTRTPRGRWSSRRYESECGEHSRTLTHPPQP